MQYTHGHAQIFCKWKFPFFRQQERLANAALSRKQEIDKKKEEEAKRRKEEEEARRRREQEETKRRREQEEARRKREEEERKMREQEEKRKQSLVSSFPTAFAFSVFLKSEKRFSFLWNSFFFL